MTALMPQLTAYDERVLAAVQRPRRARDLVREFHPDAWWSAQRRAPEVAMRYGRVVNDLLADIKLTLRGLEHLGLVKRSPNGWYRAT